MKPDYKTFPTIEAGINAMINYENAQFAREKRALHAKYFKELKDKKPGAAGRFQEGFVKLLKKHLKKKSE